MRVGKCLAARLPAVRAWGHDEPSGKCSQRSPPAPLRPRVRSTLSPPDVLDAILADASARAQLAGTRALRPALATGEWADWLRAAYTEEFDWTLDAQTLAAAKRPLRPRPLTATTRCGSPTLTTLRPHQVEVARLLYGAYAERHDHEGRDRANRRNAAAFDALSSVSSTRA